MNKTHKTSLEEDSQYNCRRCKTDLTHKHELDNHILEEHKSYKPCRNVATNSCEYNEKCRFNHEVLPKGEQLCFKCGDKFSKKSILLNHIKNYHIDPCLKYLEGKCTYGIRCVYQHKEIIVQEVGKTFGNVQAKAPHINSHQDFPKIPPTEKRLVGNKDSTEQLIANMNNMMSQMNKMITLMTQMIMEKRQ